MENEECQECEDGILYVSHGEDEKQIACECELGQRIRSWDAWWKEDAPLHQDPPTLAELYPLMP